LRKFALLLVLALPPCVTPAASAQDLTQQTPAEKAVWKLEHSYWKFVQTVDLKSYRTLWHPNFVGWPNSSSAPAHKDHITDWIGVYTSKGLRLKSFELKPAASQATGDIVVTHYWLTSVWSAKDGDQPPSTMRITHTWIKAGDNWQILGGMSAPEPNPQPAEK
jgi:ketosteroid isomerase-like protein